MWSVCTLKSSVSIKSPSERGSHQHVPYVFPSTTTSAFLGRVHVAVARPFKSIQKASVCYSCLQCKILVERYKQYCWIVQYLKESPSPDLLKLCKFQWQLTVWSPSWVQVAMNRFHPFTACLALVLAWRLVWSLGWASWDISWNWGVSLTVRSTNILHKK